MTRRIISLFMAILATGISVAVGLWRFQAQDIQVFFTVCLPILLFVFADQTVSFLDRKDERVKNLDFLKQHFPLVDYLCKFDGSIVAFEYINRNVLAAKQIYNTRISSRTSKEPGVQSKQSTFDKLIKHALKKGTNYNVIVSKIYEDHTDKLRKFVINTNPPGQFKGTVVLDSKYPVINFMLFDYPSGKSEVLMGWAVSENYDHTRPVFLIKDKDVIEFFRFYHEKLSRVSENG